GCGPEQTQVREFFPSPFAVPAPRSGRRRSLVPFEETRMNSEAFQLLWYAGFTILGFLLRHLGMAPMFPVPAPPLPTPGTPQTPVLPADHPLLVNLSALLGQLLKILQNQTSKS